MRDASWPKGIRREHARSTDGGTKPRPACRPCGGKLSYGTRKMAAQSAAEVRRTTRAQGYTEWVSEYRCPVRNGWHIGHPPGLDQSAATEPPRADQLVCPRCGQYHDVADVQPEVAAGSVRAWNLPCGHSVGKLTWAA